MWYYPVANNFEVIQRIFYLDGFEEIYELKSYKVHLETDAKRS